MFSGSHPMAWIFNWKGTRTIWGEDLHHEY